MNKDYKRRDEIIFGKYEPELYFGGCRNFRCSYETMKQLVNEDFIELNECQNDSPSTEDFINILSGINDVEFIAYAVSPERPDYRITIEGVDVIVSDTDFDTVSMLVESFHYADEFEFQHNGNCYYFHAWWD